MKRKIIKIADKTLVVSLPTAWVQSQNLDKGGEVDVEVADYKLIITPPQDKLGKKTIELDVKGMSKRVLKWQISSLHKQGYDEIVVLNYDKEQQKTIEWTLQTLFVGFMVKEKTKLRIVIGQVAVVDAKEFNATLRRAFRLLNTQIEEFIEAFDKQDASLLHGQIGHEESNNKLTNFCERLLNQTLVEKEKGHFWYVIAWNLEKISDNFKYMAQYFGDSMISLSDETMKLLVDLQMYLNSYYELFYNFSFEKLVKISEQKQKLEKECLQKLVNTQGHEAIVLHYIHMITLQAADFSASTIAINYNGD